METQDLVKDFRVALQDLVDQCKTPTDASSLEYTTAFNNAVATLQLNEE